MRTDYLKALTNTINCKGGKKYEVISQLWDSLLQMNESNSPRFEPITGCACMDLITGM